MFFQIVKFHDGGAVSLLFLFSQVNKGGENMDPCGHCFEECGLGVWHYPCPCIEANASVCKE